MKRVSEAKDRKKGHLHRTQNSLELSRTAQCFLNLLQKQSACVIRCQAGDISTENTKNCSEHANESMGREGQ
jgi:hypothetical protein